MINGKNRNTVTTGLILLLFLIMLPALQYYGKSQRVTDQGAVRPATEAPVVLIDRPEEAYRIWQRAGFRGRIVLSLGRRLNFVQPASDPLPASAPFPLAVHSLPRAAGKGLTTENVLRICMESGIAREVVHVVPDSVFREKLASVQRAEGAFVRDGRIETRHFGAPRSITPLASLRPPHEPVLLMINASMFREITPEELHQKLAASGVRTDSLLLCLSVEDPEVSEADRKRMRLFMALQREGK